MSRYKWLKWLTVGCMAIGVVTGGCRPEQKQLAPQLTDSIGMRFKLIPAGDFLMGCPSGDSSEAPPSVLDDSRPAHRVTISRPFYLALCEVTQANYQRVTGRNPSYFKGPQNPVERVSWEAAIRFCRELSALPEEQAAGRTYRLPTEAEWEYACRAGSTTVFPFGDDPTQLGQHAWFRENSGITTHPVGHKQPNDWGLYDMQGNVWEWCQDPYGNYSSEAVVDPQGTAIDQVSPPEAIRKVLRGGSFNVNAGICTSSVRFGYSFWSNEGFISEGSPGDGPQGGKASDFGFRVVLVLSDR